MILAVDPGKATGVALYHETDGFFSSSVVPGGITGFVDWFWEIPWPTTIICEKFTIGAMQTRTTSQYDALYINGYLLGCCWRRSVPFIQQPVTSAKTFATNDKLKTLGWYNPEDGGHAADAARHLLTYLSRIPLGQDIMRKLLESNDITEDQG